MKWAYSVGKGCDWPVCDWCGQFVFNKRLHDYKHCDWDISVEKEEMASELKVPTSLPTDSDERKRTPMCSGLLDYFTAALAEVAKVSWEGNEKHNKGQPLHWSRGKSADHADCIVRHLAERGGFDGKIRHSAALAWRALALLQEELEAEGLAPMPRGARFDE